MYKIECYELFIIICIDDHPFSAMPEYDYRMSPLHVWCVFMVYNLFSASIGVLNMHGLLHTIFSLDYRVLLIGMNMIGLYLFLRHVRIDFTLRMVMNHREP